MASQAKRVVESRRDRHRGNWTEDTMKEAIKEVRKGAASIAKVGEKYGIPDTSIRDWMSGKTSSKKRGPRTVLSKEEEDALVDWCMEMRRNGHSITFYMLRRKVADVCQGRDTPFKNGIPGKSWMDWFRKRHPNVTIEAAHALKGKKRSESERDRLGSKAAAGMEEAHDPNDMISQDTNSGILVTTSRHMYDINGEEAPPLTPGFDPWRGQECSDAGGDSSYSDKSDSIPSSASSRDRRKWIELTECLAGIEQAIRESEERKDRRLERQLEANDRIAASFISALNNLAESLQTLHPQG